MKTKREVIEQIKQDPAKYLEDMDMARKSIIADRIIIDQLTKRLTVMEHFYGRKIQLLEEEVKDHADRAMVYWRTILRIRATAMEAL